ncbi:hypothetical protein AAHE18_08G154500 [Arachis hypogaea]
MLLKLIINLYYQRNFLQQLLTLHLDQELQMRGIVTLNQPNLPHLPLYHAPYQPNPINLPKMAFPDQIFTLQNLIRHHHHTLIIIIMQNHPIPHKLLKELNRFSKVQTFQHLSKNLTFLLLQGQQLQRYPQLSSIRRNPNTVDVTAP